MLQEVFDKKYSTNLNECAVGVCVCGKVKAMLSVTQDKIREIRVNERSIAEYEEREKRIATLEKECSDLKCA